MVSIMLAAVLIGTGDCPNGQCNRPVIRIRVPGVKIAINPVPAPLPRVRVAPRYVPLAPTARYWRRGLFGKWKVKYKAKARGW